MTAVACLRVLLSENDAFADPETLVQLVGKIGGAFLESRWKWPRRWGAIAPFAFALADPRIARLDPVELQQLSRELHQRLFGERGDGEVCLMMLEGAQEDVMRFATAETDLLHEIVARGGGALYGYLSAITPHAITTLESLDSQPPWPEDTPALAETGAAPAGPAWTGSLESPDRGYRGVYHPARQIFIGSVVVARPYAKAPLWSVVDGLREMPASHTTQHDLACLETAREALMRPGGVIFVPINFSAIVHGSVRRLYAPVIAQLPIAQRNRLAAAVYDTPRDPSWSAMTQLKSLLEPRFAFVDLQIADPDFAIDKLPENGAVTSVTFALPEGDEKRRMAVAAHFLGKQAAYRRRRIWPAVANIRSRRELEACIALKAQFVMGRAVTTTLTDPPDATPRALSLLPLNPGHTAPRQSAVA